MVLLSCISINRKPIRRFTRSEPSRAGFHNPYFLLVSLVAVHLKEKILEQTREKEQPLGVAWGSTLFESFTFRCRPTFVDDDFEQS